MSNLSNGSLERQVKGELRNKWKQQNARCAYCREPILYDAHRSHPRSLNAAHKLSVKTHPHLAYDPNNYVPAHRVCNQQAQTEAFTQKKWVKPDWG